MNNGRAVPFLILAALVIGALAWIILRTITPPVLPPGTPTIRVVTVLPTSIPPSRVPASIPTAADPSATATATQARAPTVERSPVQEGSRRTWLIS